MTAQELTAKLGADGGLYVIGTRLPDGGVLEIHPSELIEFAEDPDGFKAGAYGITKSAFAKIDALYPTYAKRSRCSGTTRKGHRCRRGPQQTGGWARTVGDFRFGINDRCPLHQEPEFAIHARDYQGTQ